MRNLLNISLSLLEAGLDLEPRSLDLGPRAEIPEPSPQETP
jgi:hypothetical protein